MNRIALAATFAALLLACGPTIPDQGVVSGSSHGSADGGAPGADGGAPVVPPATELVGTYVFSGIDKIQDSDGFAKTTAAASKGNYLAVDDHTLAEQTAFCPFKVTLDRTTGIATVEPTACSEKTTDGTYISNLKSGSGVWTASKVSLTVIWSITVDSKPGWTRTITSDLSGSRDASISPQTPATYAEARYEGVWKKSWSASDGSSGSDSGDLNQVFHALDAFRLEQGDCGSTWKLTPGTFGASLQPSSCSWVGSDGVTYHLSYQLGSGSFADGHVQASYQYEVVADGYPGWWYKGSVEANGSR